jgi:hypothetical protein
MSISSTMSDSLLAGLAALISASSPAFSLASVSTLLAGARTERHRSQLHRDAHESGRCRTTENT